MTIREEPHRITAHHDEGASAMKIIKHGTTVKFLCPNCDCEYEVGINSARTNDGGENYYSTCPCCGAECHADAKDVKRYDL